MAEWNHALRSGNMAQPITAVTQSQGSPARAPKFSRPGADAKPPGTSQRAPYFSSAVQMFPVISLYS